MQWEKSKIVLNVWKSHDFRIVENPEEVPEKRFRLDGKEDAEDEYFCNLKLAQNFAAVKNELELVRQDNVELRQALDLAKQAQMFEKNAVKKPVPVQVSEEAVLDQAEESEHESDFLEEERDVSEGSDEPDPWFDGAPPFSDEDDGRGVPAGGGRFRDALPGEQPF